MADVAKFSQHYQATEPEKIRAMSGAELDNYHRYFVDVLPQTARYPSQQVSCEKRIQLLGSEMDRRRFESQTERRHNESLRIGKQTLLWTIVTLAVVVLFGVIQYLASKPTPNPMPAAATVAPSQTQTPTPESSVQPKP